MEPSPPSGSALLVAVTGAPYDPHRGPGRVGALRPGRRGGAAGRDRRCKGDEPLAPVTVVVPSNHVGVATRRLLASGALGPVCAAGRRAGRGHVRHAVPAGRAARRPGAGRRRAAAGVDAGDRRGAARGARRRRRASSRRSPRTPPPRRRSSPPTASCATSRRPGSTRWRGAGPRAADVVRLHRAARASLEAGVVRRAGPDGRRGRGAAGRPGRPRPRARWSSTSRSACPATRPRCSAPSPRSPTSTVLAGATGDAPRRRRAGRGARARSAPDAPSPPALRPATATPTPARTRIVLASDADDEVRAAVRAVVDAVRAGTPLDRIAVLYAGAEPYARLVHEHLAAAGIADQRAGRRAARRPGGRAGCCSTCSRCPSATSAARTCSPGSASAPVLHRRAVGADRRRGSGSPARPGSSPGAPTGTSGCTTLADDRDAQADARRRRPRRARVAGGAPAPATPRGPGGSATSSLGLIDDLAGAAAAPAALGRARRAGPGGTSHACSAGSAGASGGRTAERKAAERVERGARPPGRARRRRGRRSASTCSARTLALELDADLGRVGRFGDGVLVGPVAMGVGLDLDLVVVLGLAEGTLPGARPRRLAAARPRAGGRRRRAAAAPRRASTASTASCSPPSPAPASSCSACPAATCAAAPSGSRRAGCSTSRRRSPGERWWAEDLLAADGDVGRARRVVRRRPAPAARSRRPSRSTGCGALLAAAPPRRRRPRRRRRRASSPAGAAVVAARRSAGFTRFDGNLAGLAVPSPVGAVTSATRLERWAGCPFAYLVQDVLGVDAVENPEDRLEITAARPGQPRPRGARAVHRRGAGAARASSPPARRAVVGRRPGPPGRDRRGGLRRLRGPRASPAGRSSGGASGPASSPTSSASSTRTTPHRRDAPHPPDRRRAGLRAARRAPSTPCRSTCPTGASCASGARPTASTSPTTARSTSSTTRPAAPTAYRGLSEDDPDQRGRRLQLAVYGVAARAHRGEPDADVRADYWFVSDQGRVRAHRLPGHRRRARPGPHHAAARSSTGIEAGVFAVPPDRR